MGNTHLPSCETWERDSGTETILTNRKMSSPRHSTGLLAPSGLVKGEKCMEVLVLDQSHDAPDIVICRSAKPCLMQEQLGFAKRSREKFARIDSPKPARAAAVKIALVIMRPDK